jgi:hypothetical protein
LVRGFTQRERHLSDPKSVPFWGVQLSGSRYAALLCSRLVSTRRTHLIMAFWGVQLSGSRYAALLCSRLVSTRRTHLIMAFWGQISLNLDESVGMAATVGSRRNTAFVSVCVCVCVCLHIQTYQSTHPSIHLHVRPSVRPYLYLSILEYLGK